MCNVIQIMCIGYMLPQLDNDLSGVTNATKSFLVGTGFVGMSIGGVAAGILVESWGRNPLYRRSLLLQGVVAILGAFSPNVYVLIMLRLLSGVGIGALNSVIFIFAPEVLAPSLRHESHT